MFFNVSSPSGTPHPKYSVFLIKHFIIQLMHII